MRYSFIQDQAKGHAVEKLCEAMQVSRSGYYEWSHRPESNRRREENRLSPKIKKIFEDSRETYGYRRIKDALVESGESCGTYRTMTLMRKLKLKAIARRKYKVTTDSHHDKPIHANTLNREFNAIKMNERWVSDITYVATQEGFLYLAVVMDLYSRRIVGWAMDERMKEDLVLDALRMALFRRKITTSLLLHSDRGSQYASDAYQQLLSTHGIQCSMSRKGNCWDNAPMESFFKTLKTECLYRQSLKTREQATRMVFDYIEAFYNRQRKHSALNYLSPMNYELTAVNS